MMDREYRTTMATLAARLRAGGRRYNPDVISVTNRQEFIDQNARLARALGHDVQQHAEPTAAERREIDRITGRYPELFDTAEDTTQDTSR